MDRVEIRPDELFAAVSSLGDEIGPLEHSHVLLDGGEAHVVATGQRRHRYVLEHRPADDVATRAIGKRPEDPVDVLVGERFYNHLVAC